MLIAFLGIQLQGTLYNYYYVILRNSVQGDSTSRVLENSKPTAFKGESQSRVNLFYKIYNIYNMMAPAPSPIHADRPYQKL